jgi:hypothetical protein
MLNRNELINRLMVRIQSFMEPVQEVQVQEVKFNISVKTTDGREMILVGDQIGIGLEIYELVEGVRVDLGDGMYELTDGTKVSVESGLVKELEGPEPEQEIEIEPATVEMCGEEMKKEEDIKMMEDPRVGELETKVADLEKQVMDLITIIEGTMMKQEKMSETINKIASQPAEEPFIPKQTEFNTDVTDKEERIKRIMQLAKQK